MADETVKTHTKRLESIAKKPFPCVIAFKGENYGVFLPADKKKAIKDKDVKALAKAVNATGGQQFEGHCFRGEGGMKFVLKCPEKMQAGDVEKKLSKIKKGVNGFLALGGAKPLGAVNVEVVENLPELPDDEEAVDAAPPPPPPPPVDVAEAAEASEAPPPAQDDPGAIFKARLTALLPELKKAAESEAGQEAKLKASEAGTLARKKDFEQAHSLLDAAEELLASAANEASTQAAPPADPGADFKQRLAALLPQIKAAAGTPAGEEAKNKATEAGVLARNKDFEQANVVLQTIEELLAQDAGGLPAALNGWKAVQSDVQNRLRGIAKEIAAAKHPESDKAVLELRAVLSQINGTPDTLQKAQETRRYLEEDDVVHDVCELADDFRTPLLREIGQIEAALGG